LFPASHEVACGDFLPMVCVRLATFQSQTLNSLFQITPMYTSANPLHHLNLHTFMGTLRLGVIFALLP
jgi:hypothetical protein